jgi:hypothetical protein
MGPLSVPYRSTIISIFGGEGWYRNTGGEFPDSGFFLVFGALQLRVRWFGRLHFGVLASEV